MTLPALRLALFPSWPGWSVVRRGLTAQLRDRVIVLPAELPVAEQEEAIDALALLLGWPVYEYGEPAALAAQEQGKPTIQLDLSGEPPPEPLPGQVVLAAVPRAAGEGVTLPHELLLLRDAVIESLGRRFSGQPEVKLVGWLPEVADSPSTALRFLDGALAARRAAEAPSAAEQYCAGLAAMVAFLLRGVETRVAQWLMALASGAIEPARLVGTEAALLGQEEALQGALDAGLAYEVPHKGAGRLRWRRPLAALGALERAPGKPTLEQFTQRLAARVPPEVAAVLERLTELRRPLGLSFPDPPGGFVGRAEELHRLERWLVPGTEVRTCALVGPSGMGKSALAALLCQRQREHFEPVWLSFASGPEAAWARVASRLRVPLVVAELQERTEAGIPRWVALVHERLRERRCLIVIDDADRMPHDALSAWLPSGAGACLVLVLCRLTPGPLVRQREALVLNLRRLSEEEKDQLLCLHSPKAATLPIAERSRLIRRLSDTPQGLQWGALLCERLPPAVVIEKAERWYQGQPLVLEEELPPELRTNLEGLSPGLRRLLEVLAVCAEWTPIDLVDALLAPEEELGSGEAGTIVQRQLEQLRGVGIETNGMLLHRDLPVASLLVGLLGAEQVRRLGIEHVKKVVALWDRARNRQDEVLKELLYDNLRLAADRLATLLGEGTPELLESAVSVAHALRSYLRGDLQDVRQQLLRLYDAALTSPAKISEPSFFKLLVYQKSDLLLDREEHTNPEILDRVEEELRAALDPTTPGDEPLLLALSHVLRLSSETGHPEKLDEAQQAAHKAAAMLPVGSYNWHVAQLDLLEIALKAAQTDPTVAPAAVKKCEELLESVQVTPAHLNLSLIRGYERRLARALLLVQGANRDPSLQRAIEVLRRSLAGTSREFDPFRWSFAQILYAKVLLAQVDLGAVEPHFLIEAVSWLRVAISHYDEFSTPSDWADAQRTLGKALARLPVGDPRDNLQHASAAFQAALRVCETGASASAIEEIRELLADAQRRLVHLNSTPAAP